MFLGTLWRRLNRKTRYLSTKIKHYTLIYTRKLLIKMYYRYWLIIKRWIYRDVISLIFYVKMKFIMAIPDRLRYGLSQLFVWLLFFYICKWRKITKWKHFLKRFCLNYIFWNPLEFLRIYYAHFSASYLIYYFYRTYMLNLTINQFCLIVTVDIQATLFSTLIMI